MSNTFPLFAFSREKIREVVVNGYAVFAQNGTGIDSSREVLQTPLFARSLLKPWQFLAADSFTDDRLWAIGMASHSGEQSHLDTLNQLAKAHGVSFANLLCPQSYPMADEERWRLELSGQVKSREFHPCSGKHLSMLIACKNHAYDLRYTNPNHPIQKRLRENLQKQIGESLVSAPDSCGVPTFAFSIAGHLKLWLGLVRDESKRGVELKTLFLQNPNLIGGKNRLDTMLMEASLGKLMAKEAADGLLMLQSVGEKEEQSCLIKIASGYKSEYLGLALYFLLKKYEGKLNAPMRAALTLLHEKSSSWIPRDQVADSLSL